MPATPLTPVEPCDFVVFGGTGDLAVRKLLPALYLRDRDGQLPAETRILATSRAGLDDDGYRDKIRGELSRFVPADELDTSLGGAVDTFVARLSHLSMDVEDDHDWPLLAERLTSVPSGRVRVSGRTAPSRSAAR